MSKLSTVLLTVAATLAASSSSASDNKIESKLADLFAVQGAQASHFKTIDKVDLPRSFNVVEAGGRIMYVSDDMSTIIEGSIIDVSNGLLLAEDFADRALKPVTSDLIKNFNRDNGIIYKPKGEKLNTIFIFSDITCGYCAKLHSEIPSINEAGIEVVIIPFYRGYGAEGFSESQPYAVTTAIYSETDPEKRRKLHDDSFEGKSVDTTTVNPLGASIVKKGHELGQAVGLQGTPLIVDSEGNRVAGYIPAETIIQKFVK
ncbi:TPA: DsbC family protein [Vibrio vulnificus]|uniref:Thiol:disulfide interchange protein n=1 Tax=Vibrio vulnificus TaxID=672 RepID=A0A8H9TFS0_VIBVL|nr:DsbC family protein [Vibrio vulnificus]HAS8540971.1 DsbC family protein [Vibrio vulnificus]